MMDVWFAGFASGIALMLFINEIKRLRRERNGE